MSEHGKQAQQCCGHSSHLNKRHWYRNPLVLTVIGISFLLIASYSVPSLNQFRFAFFDYAKKIWAAILAGFILGGLIDYYIPREYITKHLAHPAKRTIFYATGLGFLMSACSHGIIALSVELHKKGASNPAVISFLLASPWANLPITFLLIGFFGFKGLLIVLMALIIALNTGFIFQFLDRKGWIERNENTVPVEENFSIRADIVKRFRAYHFTASGFVRDLKGVGKGAWALANMVLWWILIGLALGSLASTFIPGHIFHRYFGPSITGLLLTVLLATVLEVCSEGTAPLAFEFYRQTGAFGNVFAFLMGGVVTDYTEIAIVWANLGKRTALWMLTVTIPQVLLVAVLFNVFFH
jgi:hypothetical protein